MQSWILCAGLTSSGKGVLQCSPILPYLLCLGHIFQDAVEFEAEVVELHHVYYQLPSVMYACSHDKVSCQALHRPYACMQAAQLDAQSDHQVLCVMYKAWWQVLRAGLLVKVCGIFACCGTRFIGKLPCIAYDEQICWLPMDVAQVYCLVTSTCDCSTPGPIVLQQRQQYMLVPLSYNLNNVCFTIHANRANR